MRRPIYRPFLSFFAQKQSDRPMILHGSAAIISAAMRSHPVALWGTDSGQAAVEAALTLPLVLFLVLGTLQLFLMGNARVQANYAVFRAVRAGVVNHGDCRAMSDAALAALLPSITRTNESARVIEAFRKRNVSAGYRYFAGEDASHNRQIFWLDRAPVAFTTDEDSNFDQWDLAADPRRLDARMVYWYALRIPFANWVMSRMFLGYYGLQAYSKANPLALTQGSPADGWVGSGDLEMQLRSELAERVSKKQFSFPIVVSHSMRMMSPLRKPFSEQCPRTK
jgi:hypothetical protein